MADSQNSSQLLVKKPRAVSVVWTGGRVVHDNEPVCRTCLREVPAKGGTLVVLRHI